MDRPVDRYAVEMASRPHPFTGDETLRAENLVSGQHRLAGLIRNTSEPIRCAWPEGTFIQGGARGIVLSGKNGAYRTAFAEVVIADTFLRGEGQTIEDAERDCWEQYQRISSCPAYPDHGPWDRGNYRNGAAFCLGCGSWFPGAVTGLAELPDAERNCDPLLKRLFSGDDSAAAEIIEIMADADELPEKEHDR